MGKMVSDSRVVKYLFLNFLINVLMTFLFPSNAFSQEKDILSDIQIVITFDSIPSVYHVEKAPLMYNKDFAFSLEEDDSNKDIYTHAFKLLNGGEAEGVTYPGLSCTDGCGNLLRFRMSSSTSSFSWFDSTDVHDPAGPYQSTITTWPDLIEMYSFKWGITNHGLTSDVGNYSYSIARNHSYIQRMTQQATPGGIDMRVFVNVNGDINFTIPAFQQDYIVCYREGYLFGNPSFDVTGIWDPLEIKMGRSYIESNQTNLSEIVDSIAAKSKNGAHHWGVVFTHSVTDGNNGYDFPTFKSHMNFIAEKYGKNGYDNMWMTTEEEVLEYLLINRQITINTQLIGNQAIISISGELPTNFRFYQTSLLVESDTKIESITVSNARDYSFNGVGSKNGLINLGWNGEVRVPPEQTAETWVSKAESSQSQEDVNIAVDYVVILPDGTTKAAFKSRLCSIQQVTLPENFCSVGIQSLNNLSVLIYPNPASDELIVEDNRKTLIEKKIELFDMTGRQVFSRTATEAKFKINVKDLQSGIYLLKLETGNRILYKEVYKTN